MEILVFEMEILLIKHINIPIFCDIEFNVIKLMISCWLFENSALESREEANKTFLNFASLRLCQKNNIDIEPLDFAQDKLNSRCNNGSRLSSRQ